METGKVINKISNRLRRRSKKIQESIGISGAKGNILHYKTIRYTRKRLRKNLACVRLLQQRL